MEKQIQPAQKRPNLPTQTEPGHLLEGHRSRKHPAHWRPNKKNQVSSVSNYQTSRLLSLVWPTPRPVQQHVLASRRYMLAYITRRRTEHFAIENLQFLTVFV